MEQDPLMQKSVLYLNEVETLAQKILTEKETKLELSNARNKYNEALRALQKSDQRTALVELDSSYFIFPKGFTENLLKKDIEKATEEIDLLYDSIKEKVSKMRDLEHEPAILGIGLKPITGAEAKAIQKAFGGN